MPYDEIKEQIKLDEGLSLKPYRCTSGKLSIGYGWNLDDNGIPIRIADELFEYAFSMALNGAAMFIGPIAWSQLSEARRGVLINMSYNLGNRGLNGFVRFRSYLQQGDYDKAANEMIDSTWYRQVGIRAQRLVDDMRNG